jgi:hypothetical protein
VKSEREIGGKRGEEKREVAERDGMIEQLQAEVEVEALKDGGFRSVARPFEAEPVMTLQ